MNGHGEAHVSHDAIKGHINKGEEEEMVSATITILNLLLGML